MDEVLIWTDGACAKNPGPGGWAAILKVGAHEKEIFGSEPDTTNNRMEMMGALKALQSLKKSCKVVLHTDSEYLCKAFQQNWLAKWENNNWETSAGTPVKNIDLWQALLKAAEPHTVTWKWVKGHAGDEYNNRCDELAVQARLSLTNGPAEELNKAVQALCQAKSRLNVAQKSLIETKNAEEIAEIKEINKNITKIIKKLENGASTDSP